MSHHDPLEQQGLQWEGGMVQISPTPSQFALVAEPPLPPWYNCIGIGNLSILLSFSSWRNLWMVLCYQFRGAVILLHITAGREMFIYLFMFKCHIFFLTRSTNFSNHALFSMPKLDGAELYYNVD